MQCISPLFGVSTNQSLRTIIFFSFLFSQVVEMYSITDSATYSRPLAAMKETGLL